MRKLAMDNAHLHEAGELRCLSLILRFYLLIELFISFGPFGIA